MNRIAAFLLLLCTLSSAAVFSATPNEACGHCVRPLSVSAETQKKIEEQFWERLCKQKKRDGGRSK